MEISQMVTSQNPRMGTTFLNPFEIKTFRRVPSVTSHILARKMRMGKITHLKISDSKKSTGKFMF
jgi:hypothetical protein